MVFSSTRLLLAASVLLLSPLNLPATSAARPSTLEELRQLCHALRVRWTPEGYERLKQFAASQVGTELGAQAEFALGFSDFERERFALARSHFERARSSAVLEDYARYYLALTLATLHRWAEAADWLRDFGTQYPTSRLARAAIERLAEYRLMLRQAEAVVSLLRSLPDTSTRPDLLLLLAHALEATRDPAETARTYQKIYYEFPLSLEAEGAGQALRELRRRLGAKFPAPTLELRLGRADRLFDGRRYRAARAAYADLPPKLQGRQKEKAQVRMAASLYAQQWTRAALAALAALAPQDSGLDAERLTLIAQCYRRLEREAEMSATIGELARRYPSSPAYEETLLAAANYFFLRGDYGNAVSFYQTLAERFPAGPYAARAHWKVAWQVYLNGSRTSAARLLEEHVQRFASSPHLPGALYWLGRLAQENHDPISARLFWMKLLERFPHTYWANRAEERLRLLPPSTPPTFPVSNPAVMAAIPPPAAIARLDVPLPPMAATQLERANTLETLALGAMAVEELRAAYEKAPASGLFLPLARLAVAEQRYALVFELAKRVVPDLASYQLEALPREAWGLIFPRPYWDAIEREAERHGLDPLLLAALIKQESAFQPDAASRQGAIGLMQVIPKTGRRLARELRLRYSKARLRHPDYNLRLGAHYLKQLLERFSGGLESALASYNAGEDRVETWQAQRQFREPAEFVESIPFTETREYVQAVMRNYTIYRRLYGQSEESAEERK